MMIKYGIRGHTGLLMGTEAQDNPSWAAIILLKPTVN
jgi:hypothetical protein